MRSQMMSSSGHSAGLAGGSAGGGSGDLAGAGDSGASGGGSTTPQQVGSLTTWSRVTAGQYHSCATRTDGTLWCWGANDHGQAGRPATTTKVLVATAIAVAPTRTVGAPSRVAAGGSHSCAATANGGPTATVCWGDDALLQLGDSGRTGTSSTPVEATVLANKADLVAAGKLHTCNISSASAGNTVNVVITCAGADDKLQSGAAPPVASINKVDLALPGANGLGVTLVASGGDHTCAVTTGGELRCFGANTHGQLGDGTNTSTATPVRPVTP
jgi:alpha-tubulin suppressor-like RCC1 family protein